MMTALIIPFPKKAEQKPKPAPSLQEQIAKAHQDLLEALRASVEENE